jgi:hypothetical protein
MFKALIFYTLCTGVPHTKPYVKSVTRVQSVVCEDKENCIAERLTIVNPTFKTVDVTITCGSEFDEATVELTPRTSLEVDVELTVQVGEEPICKMAKWTAK